MTPKRRVLYADDDAIITTMLTPGLERRGWRVQVVRDAMQAVMFAAKDPRPDVVVLDLSMPAGSGFHSLERIRASMRTSSIPVVVVTGSVEKGVEERVLKLGATAFLRKPIAPDALADVLDGIMAQRAEDPE